MKLLKKLLLVGALLTTAFGFGLTATSCDKGGDTSVPEDSQAYIYRVSVQNETGFGFSGVTVKLMDGDKVVATRETNNSGNANFSKKDVAKVGAYTIVVENAPAGYVLPDKTYTTVAAEETDTIIPITPTGVLEGSPATGDMYKRGEIMYDFTATLTDGSKFTLSEILEEKKLVMINFWATWCGPCKSEFPAMNNSLKAAQTQTMNEEVKTPYSEDVYALAISTTDDKNTAAKYISDNGLDELKVATVSGDAACSQLYTMFQVGAIPRTIMIDRYGVIAYDHEGSMPSVSSFTMQYDKFIGDDYVPTVVPGKTQDEDPDEGNTGPEQILPTVAAPKIEDLKKAFATESANGFAFRFQEEEGLKPGDEEYDEYNWPWVISEDKQYIYASNSKVHSSYSILYSTVTVKAGDALVFDYKVGSEADCDILYVMLDGEIITKYSGYLSADWNTSYAYVFKDYEAGEHEIAFVFLKDADNTYNDDVIQLKDLRILTESDLNSPSINANIFRHAATELNTDENATTQFKRYITPVFNEEDGYYHVDAKNGPVLYANMMTASHWNESSLWMLAYSNYVVGDGLNYCEAIEDYAWEASQVSAVNGYTAVTEDLKYMLDIAARNVTIGQKFDGPYHKNEWLELCVYWEHYGDPNYKAEDPLAGITFAAAIPMQEGENEVSVPYAINPRGFKYKFIPERSGAFHVYSTGKSDTFVSLMKDDRETMLGIWDNKVFEVVGDDESAADGNFEFYWYFEEGVTYYMLFTTYLDMAAVYNVNIDYLGESYQYLDNASVGPYSMNETTGEVFLLGAIDYAYSDPAEGGDGYYHHVKKDGTLGSIIYMDIHRPTAANFFGSMSIDEICKQALGLEEFKENGPLAPEKRAFYVNGVDYTPEIRKLCLKAMNRNDELKGFVAVDKEVFDLLQTILLSDKYEGIEDTWQLLCYYYKTLDADHAYEY